MYLCTHPLSDRALRTQQFLAFTAADLAAREVKQKALLQEFEATRRGKLVSKAELDDFYTRLQVGGWARVCRLVVPCCSADCLRVHAPPMHACRRMVPGGVLSLRRLVRTKQSGRPRHWRWSALGPASPADHTARTNDAGGDALAVPGKL